MAALDSLLDEAWAVSRRHCGHNITFYLPGMFIYDSMKGNYPAISITGKRCDLHCEHCRGKLLASMVAAPHPATLIESCRRLAAEGAVGVLLSGGCDSSGRLPWRDFLDAVEQVKSLTGLHISVHTGFIGKNEAKSLQAAGVDQALIDIIGDESIYQRVFHIQDGRRRLLQSLDAITEAGLQLIPHIVSGIDYGTVKAEERALTLLSGYPLKKLVIVSLMALPGTGMSTIRVAPEDTAAVIARARLLFPDTPISLGCARRRGDRELELLALRAGVNAMALPSEEVIACARAAGLVVSFQKTCCSLPPISATPVWS